MIGPERSEMLVTLTVNQLKDLIREGVNMALDERGLVDSTNGSPEERLSAGELAEAMNVPISWVRSMTSQGAIPYKKYGKYRRYILSEVESSMKSKDKNKG